MPYLLVVILGLTLVLVKRYTGDAKEKTTKDTRSTKTEVNRNRGFDRRISYIEYTEHAKCRMKCRKITQAEVEEIMKEGKINYNKSDVKARPCPEYALEGITNDQQRVRIVFGQCDTKTRVITCIDLETEWACECPGDDEGSAGSPYKNRN
jgi:hypothetical protein